MQVSEDVFERYVYNPLSEDFSVTYDLEGTQNPQEFTIKAGEAKAFPVVVAKHIKKHLADRILQKRGKRGFQPAEREAVLEEISISDDE